MNKRDWALFMLGSGLVLFGAVWLSTRPAIWPGWNLSQAGGIGDAIGGIASPIIELVGGVLIYLSFKQQLEANKMQFSSHNEQKEQSAQAYNYQRLMELYADVEADLEKLKYIKYSSLDTQEHFGPDALEFFVSDVKKSGNEVFEHNKILMNELLYLTSSFYYLTFKIEALHGKLNETDRSIVLQKIQFIYHARFDENLALLVNYAYHSKEQKFKNWGIALNDMNKGIRTLFKLLKIYQ